MRPNKEQIERAIFDVVYDPARYFEIEHRDRPDFAVYTDSGRKLAFGVEITEVYTSDSHARLQNIDGYFDELISGEPPRHKDDIEELKVEKVKILDEHGNVKIAELPVIFRKIKDVDLRPALLAARIGEKNTRAADYDDGLTHVNLVIHDRSQNTTPGLSDSYPVDDFLSAEVKKVLNQCVFNEVHVVAADRDRVQAVRPLRAMALVEAGYMFLQALRDRLGQETIEVPDEDAHSLFIEACGRNGLMLDYVEVDNLGPCAYYGGVGIHFGESGTTILETSDRPRPTPFDIPPRTFDPEIAEQWLAAYDSLISNNSFSCALAFPAIKSFKDSFNWPEHPDDLEKSDKRSE